MNYGRLIYKICRKGEYDKALHSGLFEGSPDDIRDGFIHFSTAAQVPGTLGKHFHAEEDLILLKLETESFGNKLKWETSRNGALFPHLYDEFDMTRVVEKAIIHWDGTVHRIEKGFLDE